MPRLSTEEGMHIDESDEHFRNERAAMRESLEPVSNVTVDRDPHSEKHSSPSISTDEGMQIDESNEASKKPKSPIRDSRQPVAKTTSETVSQQAKQPLSNSAMVAGIGTVASVPKKNLIETQSKSRRKLSTTLKLELPSATEISVR
jgi:hypothetical protein